MERVRSFCVRFSELTLKFTLPTPIALPEDFAALRCDDVAKPDGEYRVELLTKPLRPDTPPICVQGDTHIYQTDKGWLHIYPPLGDGDGCQVACLFCSGGVHTLYYPASRWEEYSRVWRSAHLIQGERLLLQRQALLLHSSLVLMEGKTVLFCGASGAGKSTQADLWHTHLGAKILNGDRTVVMKKTDGFYGGGSIWSGTSHIYHPEQAPIAGIFLVTQAMDNRVEPLGAKAFGTLFSQTILNTWDSEYMDTITGLLADLLGQVPVYRLYCRPDAQAAALGYATLFEKEPL